jgi:glycosyltransferase involved in cell wall biosynthesis
MNDRPRILVAIKGLGIGGAERLIAEGSRFWDQSAFDYRVVYLLPKKHHLVPDLVTSGIPVQVLSSLSITPATLWRLGRAARDADLVHAHLPSVGIAARLAAGQTPVIYTEHNSVSSYRPLTRALNKLTYGRNAAVVAVSEHVAGKVAAYSGPRPIMIPNGVAVRVDLSRGSLVRESLGLTSDSPLVVHVGNIRPGKGHENLIAAARVIATERPEVRIVSIGAEKVDGDLERLRQSIRVRGLDPHIRLLGQRADAISYTVAATVYVNPSSVEGLPVALLEAMALARPVVATAAGGVPQVVIDGQTGLLVEPDNPEALAAAILRMLLEPEEAARMAKAGSELVESTFGLEAMVRSYESLYRRVLHG